MICLELIFFATFTLGYTRAAWAVVKTPRDRSETRLAWRRVSRCSVCSWRAR